MAYLSVVLELVQIDLLPVWSSVVWDFLIIGYIVTTTAHQLM